VRYYNRLLLGLVFGLGSLILPAAARSRSSSSDSPDHPTPQIQRKTVPVRIFRGFLVVVEGRFGTNLEHQNFLLDTGTSPSIINKDLAAPLDLTKSSAILASVGQDSKVQSAVLQELQIGPIRVNSLPIILSDLSQLENDLGIPVAGIIGLDVLSRASFSLDYAKKSIEFGRFTAGGVTVPLPVGSSIAVAQVNWGGIPKRMIVDTGSEQLVLLGKEPPFVRALHADGGPGATATANSVANRLTVQQLPPADIVLAGKKFSTPKAYWVPGSDASDSDGLLGVRSLGFRRVSFDSQTRTLHLVQ
jgi:predicted aspartyl protease